MKRYKIERKYDAAHWCKLNLKHGAAERTSLMLGKNPATDELHAGNHIWVLRDKFLSIEDYVYLYRGGFYMKTWPAWMDSYSCKMYIDNLPGLFDYGRLDRAMFKVALWRECERRGITPSFTAWHNLQNIMIDRAKGNPRR